MARLFDPLHAAVDIYSRLNRLSVSIRRMLEVLEMRPSVPERSSAVCLTIPVRGRIEMMQVSFAYRAGALVLEGLNLKIEAGEKIAVVGVSGSGKSTIAKLVARLYDVNDGAV